MRKLIVEAEVSLDGTMNGPEFWEQVFKYHSDDVQDYLDRLLFGSDALVLGRMTYEVFAEVWSSREGKMAEYINSMPKYVASRTLKGPLAWNATLLEGNIPTALRTVKQESGKDLVQYGVGELTNTMFQHGLVDELRLLVFPFTFGKGPRVFDHIDMTHFRLLDAKALSSGTVALHYHPLQSD